MRTRWVAILVIGLAIVVGCKRKPAASVADSGGPAPATVKAGRGAFTIGKATTFVTSPKDSSGHIDYPAALNERLHDGVTLDNNANALIWKAIGPDPFEEIMPPGYFDVLGMPVPTASPDNFIGLKRYAGHVENLTEKELFAARNRCSERPWTANEQPAISAWLNANEKSLAGVIEATKRTRYFSPVIPSRRGLDSTGIVSAILPGPQVCRELARTLTARAMLYTANGAADAAWQDLLACHRLSRLIGQGGTLIEGLVGHAIDMLASKADLAFLEQTQPDVKRLETYLHDLATLTPMPDEAGKVDWAERFMFLDTVMQLDKQGLGFLQGMRSEGQPLSRVEDLMLKDIDWDPALELANRWYDRLVASMREKNRAQRSAEMAWIENDLRDLRIQATGMARYQQLLNEGMEQNRAKGLAVGEILASLLLPAVWKVHDAADRAAQTFENVVVAFALARHHRDKGNYPASLEPISMYLGRAPRDLFTGGALIYKPAAKGYLLYSVGPNGKDDGGNTKDDEPPGDDIVVRMPLPPR